MSAFLVNKAEILYLAHAAIANLSRLDSSLRWVWGAQRQKGEVACGDYAGAAEVANMLWRANIASVAHYCGSASSANLPGPRGGAFVLHERDVRTTSPRIEPVQVLKCIDFFEYQSNERPEWRDSEAKAFCDALRRRAIRALPGYDEAEWGAPAETRAPR